MLSKPDITKTDAWKTLQDHKATLASTQLKTLFAEDSERFDAFSIQNEGMLFDYSKHYLTDGTISLLCDFARTMGLENRRAQLFRGEPINTSENRPVLHTALRNSVSAKTEINDENIQTFVERALQKIKTVSEKIRDTPDITDVVHIGIGGSHLGPQLVCSALAKNADGPNIHFLSNIDDDYTDSLLKSLPLDRTCFIIASKTFGTLETLHNAKIAKARAPNADFYAITQETHAALSFGIPEDNILPMRPWIGGRYSLWSCVGLPIAIALGFNDFQQLLEGARTADTHFQNAPLEKNIPVLMGVIGLWYRNFWNFEAHAVLPYSQFLENLPSYLQQLDMESNGKSTNLDGDKVSYGTAPVVFGANGTNAQHAFFQLLHQGTQIIPCDFIGIADASSGLAANMIAQSQALMQGDISQPHTHRHFPGNRPSSTILLDTLSPWHLGYLLATYEHKTFVQGVLWHVNSFDQWGVELGKTLAGQHISVLQTEETISETIDASTRALLGYLREKGRNI